MRKNENNKIELNSKFDKDPPFKIPKTESSTTFGSSNS